MQTLRKRNSPCKFKNEPTRFLGEGVSFKAKLIGILEVSEARGDRMCQAALADLKMAIRAAGEHKQRIAVQVSIDGLRLRDEKTGDCLYHHPVHKISFIAQDMSDSRAFGYIFGSPDTGHRFFGIKTDKAANQVVIAMRDLFQVVFELKKKEIELAKQHIEQNAINAIKFHSSGIFVEPAPDTKGAAGAESSLHKLRSSNAEVEKSIGKNESQSGVIADLLDLQFELNSLQQGIHQMDKITPENPVRSTDDLFETDPFGDSFTSMKVKETVRPILPPPPSSSKRGHLERQQTVPAPSTSSTSSPAATLSSKTPPPQSSVHWFDKETENLFNDDELTNLSKSSTKKEQEEVNSKATLNATPRNAQAKSPQIDVFTELDPLGTGLIKPYIDKKDFFQHLKNPPKKILKDLVTTGSSDTFPTNFNVTTDPLEPIKQPNDITSLSERTDKNNFANFDHFEESQASQTFTESPQKKDRQNHRQPLSVSLPPEEPTITKTGVSSSGTSVLCRMDRDSTESMQPLVKLPSPKKYLQSRKRDFDIDLGRGQSIDKPFPVDFSTSNDSPASPLRSCSSDANSRLSSSSAELDLVPEPPPRGAGNILINPPPLPPKKQATKGGIKPPPRPPYTEGHFHYDFLEREVASPSPTRTRERNKSPPRETKSQFDDNFSPPSHLSSGDDFIGTMTSFEDSFGSMIPTTNLSSFFTCTSTPAETKRTKPTLDITLSQLTSSNLDELANSLGMTVQELTSLTLQQLTECLATLSMKESAAHENKESKSVISQQSVSDSSKIPSKTCQTPPCKVIENISASNEPTFKTNFEQEPKQDPTYDKYAVFRELLEMEQSKEEMKLEDPIEEESGVEEMEGESQDDQECYDEKKSDSLASLTNLTVKLPPSSDDLPKEDRSEKVSVDLDESSSTLVIDKEEDGVFEDTDNEKEKNIETMIYQATKESNKETVNLEEDVGESEKSKVTAEIEERGEISEKGSDGDGSPDKTVVENNAEETSSSSVAEKAEVKSSTSTSSDKYAALREIIGKLEKNIYKKTEEETSPRQPSPVQSSISKSLAEVELLNLFSDGVPPPSPKKIPKKEEETKTALDIFEEIKMLNTAGTPRSTTSESRQPTSGFEDVFCPFTEARQEEPKEDTNWAKFDSGVFGCEGPHSLGGGTSPWSPDGKEFHRDVSFKGSTGQRHSGDSDNEWKDEEESEESNGRVRADRYWCDRHPRFESSAFEDRSFYDESTDKRDRSFRDRSARKSRGGPWPKGNLQRPRDPSPWHEGQWEDEPRRYPPHRRMPYKDHDEDQYEHWKCGSGRQKQPQQQQQQPQRWNWGGHDHAFYDDERKRKLMLWNEEDRFSGSQESMGYEDEERWPRRKYDRRRWEEDARFWGRRDPDYHLRDSYYYYRESRERAHDYPTAWDEEYGPEPRTDESPRYNHPGRKRHWPKRPNSANEGRGNSDYVEAQRKFGASRSECSDNDSDPYLRPQRSRSRDSYWGSDQEYDSWVERPYWSEGPDTKTETLHRKRIPRHKVRQQPQPKAQSPFEDDFAQTIEPIGSPAVESSKREPPPPSPSSGSRSLKDHRRDVQREYKRSSFFEDDLTPTASASSDTSDRQRIPSDLKATPEELPCDDAKEPRQSLDAFVPEDPARDSFFNGDLRFEDDAFAFKQELEDSVPDRATTLPLKNSRQNKYGGGSSAAAAGNNNNNNNNNNKSRNDQYIRKSESVNIFVRENDPFDDDDFFN